MKVKKQDLDKHTNEPLSAKLQVAKKSKTIPAQQWRRMSPYRIDAEDIEDISPYNARKY